MILECQARGTPLWRRFELLIAGLDMADGLAGMRALHVSFTSSDTSEVSYRSNYMVLRMLMLLPEELKPQNGLVDKTYHR